MAESSPNRLKTPWEKEKLLVTSTFSFSHSVFHSVLQTRKNQGLFGKGLRRKCWCVFLLFPVYFYIPCKTNVFGSVLESACQSVCVSMYQCVCVSICVQNTSNFSEQTSTTVLLQLYLNFAQTMIIYLKFARRNFEVSALSGSGIIFPSTKKSFVKLPVSVKVLAWVLSHIQ